MQLDFKLPVVRWRVGLPSPQSMMTFKEELPILARTRRAPYRNIAHPALNSGENNMTLSDPSTDPVIKGLGPSVREFLAYSDAERERRLNSGEVFDREAFDQAVEMVLARLRMLADEGWR